MAACLRCKKLNALQIYQKSVQTWLRWLPEKDTGVSHTQLCRCLFLMFVPGDRGKMLLSVIIPARPLQAVCL